MTTDCLPLNPDEYVKNPNFCPYCGSPEINASHSTFDSDHDLTHKAWQAVTCDACASEWNEIYTLTGYELVSVWHIVEPA